MCTAQLEQCTVQIAAKECRNNSLDHAVRITGSALGPSAKLIVLVSFCMLSCTFSDEKSTLYIVQITTKPHYSFFICHQQVQQGSHLKLTAPFIITFLL